MTADSAIASIREDIDRLERKNVVKPGHIIRRREEVEAIASELASLRSTVQRLTAECGELLEQRSESDLRMGMLANVVSILGFDPMPHVRRPLADNPDVYMDAAAFVDELRTLSGYDYNRPRSYTRLQLQELLNNALWAARLNRRLTPGEKLNAEAILHAIQHEEVEP